MRKKEIFFTGFLLVIAAGWMIFPKISQPAAKAIVFYKNEKYGSYSLDEDQMIQVGSRNLLEITGGKIRMNHADCPDRICVKQGFIESKGESIICLPNSVVVSLENTGEEIDGVVH